LNERTFLAFLLSCFLCVAAAALRGAVSDSRTVYNVHHIMTDRRSHQTRASSASVDSSQSQSPPPSLPSSSSSSAAAPPPLSSTASTFSKMRRHASITSAAAASPSASSASSSFCSTTLHPWKRSTVSTTPFTEIAAGLGEPPGEGGWHSTSAISCATPFRSKPLSASAPAAIRQLPLPPPPPSS
jgi:hypothetical protein